MKRNNVKPGGPRPSLLSLPRGFAMNPGMPAFLAAPSREQEFEAAIRHHQAGRTDEADKVCGKLLARNPSDADALHLRGVMAAQAGRFDDAVKLIGRAIEIQPTAVPYYRNLVNALKDSGQSEPAVKACRQFLRLQPKTAEMHNQLGNLLVSTGQREDAIVAFREAVRLTPGYAEAWNNLGMALADAEKFDDAIAAYRQSIARQPMPQTWNNLGNALKSSGQRDAAIECYRIAVQLNPNSAEMWNNLGNTLRETGELEQSIAALDRAISLNSELVSAQWNLALALLQHGDLPRGFAKYEWRWQLKDFPSKAGKYPKPQWHGEDLAGRNLLLHVEQGRGDVIQFIRYAALVAARGGNVILHCPEEIARLLQTVAGVTKIVSTGDTGAFDFHSPLMSLPLAFGTTLETIPASIPYIHPDAESARVWDERLRNDSNTSASQEQSPAAPPRDDAVVNSTSLPDPHPPQGNDTTPSSAVPLRVGLVWAGSPIHGHDKTRSMTLAQFAPLSRVPGVALYTLQKGDPASQAGNPPSGMKLIDYTADLHDFADTAALISHLDLVIAVDTAVAHLAGAMGKKVWVLLPFVPDWRWMSGREDSPWYPTMRLFRQRVEGDWAEVIERVAEALGALD